MVPTITETIAPAIATLSLQAEPEKKQGATWWSSHKQGEYPYAHYLPTYEEVKLPPWPDYKHVDPGLKALEDREPRSFLKGASIEDLTPNFGTEVSGVQLHKLDERGRQQLALFVAQRGVVAFRDQDFVDQDIDWLVNDWTTFFGRPHVHPTSGAPKGWKEIHLVNREPDSKGEHPFFANRLTSTAYHSDVSYEKNPPGTTALFLLDSPEAGGDTGFQDQRAAYNHLSPNFRAYLETLQVVHSGVSQADFARQRDGLVRREPVENAHPLVRRHPVTGEKALFINRGFSRHIVGLKQEESDAILELLYDHIAKGADFQTRVRWRPRTVVLWDNRTTTHTAILDYNGSPARRHGARLTPQAEVPFI